MHIRSADIDHACTGGMAEGMDPVYDNLATYSHSLSRPHPSASLRYSSRSHRPCSLPFRSAGATFKLAKVARIIRMVRAAVAE